MRRIATFLLLVLLCTAAAGSLIAAKRAANLAEQMQKLYSELREIKLAAASPTAADEPADSVQEMPIRTAVEVREAIRKLDNNPTAATFAAGLTDLDAWVIRPEEEQAVLELKHELAARLRGTVKQEVEAKQGECLNKKTGDEAVQCHAEAGELLAFYPMDADPNVTHEAKVLAARQVEIATRIDLLRRQRYNRWAASQIETAIRGYNDNSSYTSPKKENKKLMDSLVAALAEVDPGMLEPAVIELYNYVIDLTKGSISELERVELAKRLTDPSIKRKTLGDF